MRKWRPAHKCIYIIPEIKGNAKSLEVILNRIIPLRFSIGQEDMLIFLGDYIDIGPESKQVLDILINLQKETDQIIFLRGDREEIFCRALFSQSNYEYWIDSGGQETVKSYTESNEYIQQSRLKEIIPSQHIEFLSALPNYYILDEYLLTHNGINLSKPLNEHTETDFLFNHSFSKDFKNAFKHQQKIPQDYIYILTDNFKSQKPFIHQKSFMLSAGAPSKLVLFELNSMSCSIIKNGKARFYKHNFKYYE